MRPLRGEDYRVSIGAFGARGTTLGYPEVACLARVRRQRVQMCILTISPFLRTICLCTFGLNVRFVFGARSPHLPACLCCMLRPNCVCLPHSSHVAKVEPPFVLNRTLQYHCRTGSSILADSKALARNMQCHLSVKRAV